jgi:hypothetical protein
MKGLASLVVLIDFGSASAVLLCDSDPAPFRGSVN